MSDDAPLLVRTTTLSVVLACPEKRLDATHLWPDGKACRHFDPWFLSHEARP